MRTQDASFQTKVLGLPSTVVGLLWLIPGGIDSVLSLFIGYASDNFAIPFLSRFYGRRKSWHLIGGVLVGACSPFFLMPCFVCGEETTRSWKIVAYYSIFLLLSYSGWCLIQTNFLALIPVVAKRQSEMVKLGAINSAITLICGMFVYIVTWALLNSDSSETLSFADWKKFMYLVIIVIVTGALFSLTFHLGTHEPTPSTEQKQPNMCVANPSVHEFSEKEYGDHVVKEIPIITHAHSVSDVIQGLSDTALVNPSFVQDEENIICLKPTNQGYMTSNYRAMNGNVLGLEVTELEVVLWEALAQNKREKEDDMASVESSSGYEDDSGNEETTSGETSDAEIVELPMPMTFIDMVPNHSELMLHSQRGSTRTTPISTPRLSRSASKSHSHAPQGNDNLYNTVLRSRLNSTNSQISPLSTPRLNPRSTAYRTPPVTTLETKPCKTGHYDDLVVQSPTVELAIQNPREENLAITDRSETKHLSGQGKKSVLRTLLRRPEFYKVAAAYLFTRASQNITTSYLPLFLTDYLKFGKDSIAFFPLVYLLSGVFASFAAKRFNKVLGYKWTFCLGSIMVMGASGWFYLLTQENRSVTYVPAILSGCGTSIMFVTTLALAAEFVDEDRESGAFMMASMSFLAKVVIGALFCLLQEFSPEITDPHYVHYTHYVFSLTPGVGAFCGILAFIVFIPATFQCKPIIKMEDAETQTDEIPFPSTTSILDVIEEDVGADEDPGQGNSCLNIIEEGDETKGNEILKHNNNEEEAYTQEESEAMERETMGKRILENVQNEEDESEELDTAL